MFQLGIKMCLPNIVLFWFIVKSPVYMNLNLASGGNKAFQLQWWQILFNYTGLPLVSHHACSGWTLEERSYQKGFRWSLGASTVTGAIGAGGVPSWPDFPPPCSLHSCLDSVQLKRRHNSELLLHKPTCISAAFHTQRARLMPLTERVGAVGVRRWMRLFGLQVREAWSLGVTWKRIQGGFGPTRMQARVGGGRLLLLMLHQQGLGQLTLVLLDLLLHVIDCTCNLRHTRDHKGDNFRNYNVTVSWIGKAKVRRDTYLLLLLSNGTRNIALRLQHLLLNL